MFKDTDKELKRLEQALFIEAQEEETRLAEESEEADALLDDPDDFGEEDELTYRNFANRYGSYTAYNSDAADEDLDDYSRQVYERRPDRAVRRLCILACFLLLGICAVLGWCVLRYTGGLS